MTGPTGTNVNDAAVALLGQRKKTDPATTTRDVLVISLAGLALCPHPAYGGILRRCR